VDENLAREVPAGNEEQRLSTACAKNPKFHIVANRDTLSGNGIRQIGEGNSHGEILGVPDDLGNTRARVMR
jgi:hypothetical protein